MIEASFVRIRDRFQYQKQPKQEMQLINLLAQQLACLCLFFGIKGYNSEQATEALANLISGKNSKLITRKTKFLRKDRLVLNGANEDQTWEIALAFVARLLTWHDTILEEIKYPSIETSVEVETDLSDASVESSTATMRAAVGLQPNTASVDFLQQEQEADTVVLVEAPAVAAMAAVGFHQPNAAEGVPQPSHYDAPRQ